MIWQFVDRETGSAVEHFDWNRYGSLPPVDGPTPKPDLLGSASKMRALVVPPPPPQSETHAKHSHCERPQNHKSIRSDAQ